MQYLNKHWQRVTWVSILLLPLSLIYCALASLRRVFYDTGVFEKNKINVPVIIIGNISVGGTGKTPLVIWLVKLLQSNKYKPGVISRGYGRSNSEQTIAVQSHNTVSETGDEPAIIFQNCNCPVVVDADRTRGARKLVEDFHCNIIISDDGLQHYKLDRDMEIVVVDGVRGHGNKLCLPAGPLREPTRRLNSVDAVVINNQSSVFGYKNEFAMRFAASNLVNVFDSRLTKETGDFSGKPVHALAGIGNPEQFFVALNALGMKVNCHAFPDHYNYCAEDITFPEYPVIMTEKDAVKIWSNKAINITDESRYWYLPVSAELPQEFADFILKKIKEKTHG